MTTEVHVNDVHLSYHGKPVLKGLSVGVRAHEVVCLIGPSGCGKSTLLRAIDGLEHIQAGEIRIGDSIITPEFVTDLNVLRRRVAIVFQSFNLFPHMSAIENVMLGPRRALRQSRTKSETVATELLARVGLADKLHSYPFALSGGQQQRVAIARALAMGPEVLLLDEVTSALDTEMVGEVLAILRELAREGMTMLIATHELGFARQVAHRICCIFDGRIIEEGPAQSILDHPRQPQTREFLRRVIQPASPPHVNTILPDRGAS